MYYNNFFDSFLEKNPLTIRMFFILIFIVFGIAIITTTFYINYIYKSELLEKELRINTEKAIKNKISYIENNFNRYRNNLYVFKENEKLKNYINNQSSHKEITSLFSHIIEADKNIMQLRFIDNNGDEKIKVARDYLGANSIIIESSQLQNKSKRYYFKEISKIKDNKVWVSDIDLNVENGKIQKPFVPIIRFAIPFYTNDNFNGTIIFNVFMENILKDLVQSDIYDISIIENNGEILFGKFQKNNLLLDLSWSKQLSKNKKIDDFYPKQAKLILNNIEFNSNDFFSKFISNDLGLKQKLFIIFKIKNDKTEELKNRLIKHALSIFFIVLIISAIIGSVLSIIPTNFFKKLTKSREKLAENNLLLDEYLKAMNINNIITKGDLEGKITYVNDNLLRVTGYEKEEILRKPHSLLKSEETNPETFKDMWKTIQSKKTWTGTLKNKKKDGSYYYVNSAIMPILNKNNEIIEYLAIRHDITELILQKKQIIENSLKDNLTNCGNRFLLSDDIHTNSSNNLAVIDIDSFSSINDFYGHNIGDIVIKKFAEHLITILNQKDFKVYRLHSDKFAILNESLTNKEFIDIMKKLNQRIMDTKINLDVKSFDIITTIGVSFENNYQLLLTAEIANKHAKKLNEHLLIYDKKLEIEKIYENNLIWVTKIKNALAEDRILIHCQAIFNNKTKKIEKYEVLVRLEDENGKIISPFFFLDFAKKSKQYINITKRVIDLSFEKFKNNDFEFSINLTIEDILNKNLTEYLIKKIKEYKIGERLVLELVESENIQEYDNLFDFIKKFKSLGCKIAIDDFGTGYSNFEYLINVDADYVKIDGSMIKDIDKNENSKEIVKTIVEFSKKMNFKTIAEFVSSEEIYSIVNEIDIDYSQGFHIGKPSEDL